MKKTILVIGSSRGIGAEIVAHFSKLNYCVIGVSRSESKNCKWIKADISKKEEIEKIEHELVNKSIDTIVFSSGIWEEYGFMDEFEFSKTSDEETRNIINVNLIAPIELTKKLAKNLFLSINPRIIYIGALSGIDNLSSSQVAYCASKFGLRGAIQSLRKAYKKEKIGFTVINPGNVGTPEVLLDIEEGRFEAQEPISISDIVSSIQYIMNLSKNVEVSDINLIQKN